MDLLTVPRFFYQKRIHIKAHLNLATEVLKGFSPGFFSRFYVTHNKNFGNLELKSELVIFLFSKVTLKARAVNSGS